MRCDCCMEVMIKPFNRNYPYCKNCYKQLMEDKKMLKKGDDKT